MQPLLWEPHLKVVPGSSSTAWQDSSGAACGGGGGASWYNSSWTYRLKLTIDNTKVDADLTDFPVYVNLNNLQWFSFPCQSN